LDRIHKGDVLDKTKEKIVAENIWLNYYNNYLFEHGVISEETRNKMVTKINGRK